MAVGFNNGNKVKNEQKQRFDKKRHSRKDFYLFVCILLIINLVLMCVWLFTAHCDKQFVAHFSFASTVTSIILSVLAIFLSITGELKTQTLRERIEQEAEVITDVTAELRNQMQGLTNKIDMVQNETNKISGALNKNPDVTQLVSSEENSLKH